MSAGISYITSGQVALLKSDKQNSDAIIFLSGPSSLKTPLEVLKANDVITVNGAARFLIENGIKPYMYVLTDSRFLKDRRNEFYEYSKNSKYTIVNRDVYEGATPEDIDYLTKNCFTIMPLYKREKGGFLKRLSLHNLARKNKSILINVPWSKKKRLVGFSKNIVDGYCSCHTVAYTALQIAYSIGYERIIFSGLDMTGSCARFYDEFGNPMPSELNRDLPKILPFFSYMRTQIPDIQVFNLSDNTVVDRKVIPYIYFDQLHTGKSIEADDARN